MNTESPSKARVLIVDDEPDIETLIRQRFKRRNGNFGFEFAFARNGAEALRQVEADPDLDLVITDINMPVMDGLELISRLGHLDGRVVKSVILSAYGDMGNIRTAMNRGAFDFLTKPIDFTDFETTLRRTRDALEIERLGVETRQRLSALEQEIEIAAQIQVSMLPREFPTGELFDIYAQIAPARRVGGDFFDFFPINSDSVGFLIGDVSGKGVPAALFMAVSRTILRATALQGLDPAECLAYVNNVLGTQREGAVFVTVFYAILHTDTGDVEFCIGGHNPPYRIASTGEIVPVDEPGGIVIGLLPPEEVSYETGRFHLKAGDSLFLFTDGVTEAMNADGGFFGERRLRHALAECAGCSSKEIAQRVLAEVAQFTEGAVQSDDITAMAVKWTPR
jgi:sigma-B regulation protein RsbU (phosphoserine phosphatase)